MTDGGSGWQLAEWIAEGEPSIDMWDVESRRFGDYATKNYVRIKNEETYEHVFIVHYPLEERPAARPAKAAPCYDRQKALGAVFGQRFGWERANWFAPKGTPAKDKYSFRRTNFHEPVGEEVKAVRERIGLLDLTGFSKFGVSGSGAEAFLDRLVANRLPKKVDRTMLAHVLTPKGGVASEFTITSRWRAGGGEYEHAITCAVEPEPSVIRESLKPLGGAPCLFDTHAPSLGASAGRAPGGGLRVAVKGQGGGRSPRTECDLLFRPCSSRSPEKVLASE